MGKCVAFQNSAKKHDTSTGQYHRFIPEVPQEFDCRVKANIKQESLNKDITIKNEQFKTVHEQEYPRKSVVSSGNYFRSKSYKEVDYIRTVEEMLFNKPPPPLVVPLSEMKYAYRMNYLPAYQEKIQAPVDAARCILSRSGCEQQPSIPPHAKGFWKWLDPFLTTNKADFIIHSDIDPAISSKIPTFYNQKELNLPLPVNRVMFDKLVFKNCPTLRIIPNPAKRVPHYGMQSEAQDHYKKQTYSITHPFLNENCEDFPDALPPAGRFQNMAAPGMYCTEYCTYGRGSTRRIVEPNYPKKEIKHTKHCPRLYDHCQ